MNSFIRFFLSQSLLLLLIVRNLCLFCLKKIAIWIKFNEAVFRVLGLIFFFLTICAGFIWLIGCDVESVAYILGMISSSMFGIIKVAKYIEPDRKVIREMSLDEMRMFIETSDPIKDWEGVTTDYASELVLIEDPRLRITMHHDETGTQCKDFKAYWANKFPNPHACGYWIDITYDRGLIDRVVLVSVDGGRAMLPVPKTTSELVVSKRDYVIACMFNDCSTLDQYMQMSGIHHT